MESESSQQVLEMTLRSCAQSTCSIETVNLQPEGQTVKSDNKVWSLSLLSTSVLTIPMQPSSRCSELRRVEEENANNKVTMWQAVLFYLNVHNTLSSEHYQGYEGTARVLSQIRTCQGFQKPSRPNLLGPFYCENEVKNTKKERSMYGDRRSILTFSHGMRKSACECTGGY